MELQSKPLFTNKMLIGMCIPMILDAYLGIAVGVADGIMVSVVGETAISGVSLVDSISNVILVLFGGLATGGAIVTSQYMGARMEEKAKLSAGQMVQMSLLISSVITVVCLLFAGPLLKLCFGTVPEAVMDAATTYFYYMAVSFPFMALGSAGSVIFRCSGNTRIPMVVNITANLINVTGNAICIYGLKMGVEGVAIPTLISRAFGGIMNMVCAVCSKKILSPGWKDVFHFHASTMGKMLQRGLPTALESSIFQIGRVMTLSMISTFGTYQLAANSTALTLVQISNIPTQGLYSILMMVVGQCVGAHALDQIKLNTKKLVGAAYAIGGTLAILSIIFRYPMISIYSSLSPETVELTAQLMMIHLVGLVVCYASSFCLNATLQAANDTLYVMIVGIASMMVIRLGLAQLLCVELGWGAVGVWAAMVMDWLCRSVLFLVRLRSGVWKKKCGLA